MSSARNKLMVSESILGSSITLGLRQGRILWKWDHVAETAHLMVARKLRENTRRDHAQGHTL
jgi:hypothetical protein